MITSSPDSTFLFQKLVLDALGMSQIDDHCDLLIMTMKLVMQEQDFAPWPDLHTSSTLA